MTHFNWDAKKNESDHIKWNESIHVAMAKLFNLRHLHGKSNVSISIVEIVYQIIQTQMIICVG